VVGALDSPGVVTGADEDSPGTGAAVPLGGAVAGALVTTASPICICVGERVAPFAVGDAVGEFVVQTAAQFPETDVNSAGKRVQKEHSKH